MPSSTTAPTTPAPAAPQVHGFFIHLGTPRRLPKPAALHGRVAVLDLAFASEGGGKRKSFEFTTLRFIEALGPRLCAWIDHHDSLHHARYAEDDRFVLCTKAEHGACPEMITPALVEKLGPVDTIVCHNDFDGLASAAKWIRRGVESYPGCDDDARAIDTRIGQPSPTGKRFDQALRGQPRDAALRLHILQHLADGLQDETAWAAVDAAAESLKQHERISQQLAAGYRHLSEDLVMLDVTENTQKYDKTSLLMLGQEQALMALLVNGDNATFAAPFGSGINFLEKFGLSGGMPTLVSINRRKLPAALRVLGIETPLFD